MIAEQCACANGRVRAATTATCPVAFWKRGHKAKARAYNPSVAAEQANTGRILALDVGSKTIGRAVSDALGITAQGLETIRRQNKRRDFEELGRTIEQYGVNEIVVGYPLHMSGAPGTQSQKMELFAQELRQRFKLPVHLWDERLTSAQANRLLREAELSIRRRAQVVDRLAAVLILQSFLEARSGGHTAPGGRAPQ
jgi:putative Holliday junction resolvase